MPDKYVNMYVCADAQCRKKRIQSMDAILTFTIGFLHIQVYTFVSAVITFCSHVDAESVMSAGIEPRACRLSIPHKVES